MGQREEIEKAKAIHEANLNELAREQEYIRQRYESRQRLYSVYTYLALIVAMVSTVFYFSFSNTPPADSAKEQQLQTEVNQLNDKIGALQASIDKASEQNDAALASQIQVVSGRVDALSATILEDPDKALTARLLREKQANLEATIKDLKEETAATRQSFNSLMIAVIAAVIGAPVLINGVSLVAGKLAKRDRDKPDVASKDETLTMSN